MIRLSIGIQHHPARPELPHRLLAQLGLMRLGAPASYDIVNDPEPFGPACPWRTNREAWRRTPEWCTHRLVIQDDAIPCRGFLRKARHAIAEHPDEPISFFYGVNSFPLDMAGYRAALLEGSQWFALPRQGWVPCVALVLPKARALDLAEFELPHHARPHVADDEVVLEWCVARDLSAWATVPSLVDHDDTAVSTMGGHVGTERGAYCFIDTPALPVV